eukprot:scaffold26965_cov106-Isochrysis_galbana.AAC.4
MSASNSTTWFRGRGGGGSAARTFVGRREALDGRVGLEVAFNRALAFAVSVVLGSKKQPCAMQHATTSAAPTSTPRRQLPPRNSFTDPEDMF